MNGDAISTIKYKNVYSIVDDWDIAENFMTLSDEDWHLNLPTISAVDSPLDMQTISKKQNEDTVILARISKHKDLYLKKN